jgi:hypothetical protein
MKSLRFLILFCLIATQAKAQISSCYDDPSGKSSRPTVLSLNFNYSAGVDGKGHQIGISSLPGASADGDTMDFLQKNLLNAKSYLTVTDRGFMGSFNASNPVADSAQTMAAEKARFLDVLRTNMANEPGPKTVMYSGHGVPCLDPSGVQHWCMVLPMHPDMTNWPKAKDGTPIFKTTDPCVVSDTDLAQATAAQNFILDSCHTGLAQKALITQSKNANGGITLLGSSLSNDLSDDNATGGRLLSELRQMVSAVQSKDPDTRDKVCALDIMGNGEISYREATLLMQLNVLRSKNVLGLGALIKEVIHSHDTTGSMVSATNPKQPGLPDVFSGLVNNSCFLKIPAGLCPANTPPATSATPAADGSNECNDLAAQDSQALLRLRKLAKDPSSISFLASADDVANATYATASQATTDFSDQQAQEAFGYLHAWVNELQAGETACQQRHGRCAGPFARPRYSSQQESAWKMSLYLKGVQEKASQGPAARFGDRSSKLLLDGVSGAQTPGQ